MPIFRVCEAIFQKANLAASFGYEEQYDRFGHWEGQMPGENNPDLAAAYCLTLRHI